MHLIFGRNNVNGEFWAIVSDEKTTLKTFEEYGLRFDIEETFLDDQSNGWNVQRSEIRCVCALSRLWFILAVATLYVTAQGVAVVKAGSPSVGRYSLVSGQQLLSDWLGVGQSLLREWLEADSSGSFHV